jgi:hypothetical protein
MKKIFFCLPALFVAISLPAQEIIHLFDGTSLSGWYTFLKDRGVNNDPKNVFTVTEGLIRISGEEWGSLTTNEAFENYHIITDFKWGDITFEPRLNNTRDCGLLLHSQGEDGGSQGIWMHSIECQIIEGGTGDIIVVGDGSNNFSVTTTVADEKQGNSYIYKPGGQEVTINAGRINWLIRDPEWKDSLGFRGQHDVEKPVGEWNQLEVVADNDNFTIYLNGKLVNKATRVKPQRGKIQIQSEGAEIFFRRVDLVPIK